MPIHARGTNRKRVRRITRVNFRRQISIVSHDGCGGEGVGDGGKGAVRAKLFFFGDEEPDGICTNSTVPEPLHRQIHLQRQRPPSGTGKFLKSQNQLDFFSNDPRKFVTTERLTAQQK